MSDRLSLLRTGVARPYSSGIPRIDWAHPLARSLFDCLTWLDAAAPLNLASPNAITTLSGAPSYSFTAAGLAGYSTGGKYYAIPDHGNIVAADFTVRVRFVPNTWPGDFTALFCKASGGIREIGVFIAAATGNVDFIEISGQQDSVVYSTGMAAGGLWDFVITRSGSTTSLYVNGVFISNIGVTGGTTNRPGSLKFGHDDVGGGLDPDIKYIDQQTWLRALSPAEIQQIYLEPYCFFAFPEEDIDELSAFRVSGAVTASLTGAQSTSAAGTITVTGFANVALQGAASTSAAGTAAVSGKANVTLSGAQSASAAGTLTITGKANVTLTGALAVTASNAPTVTGFANVSVIGASSASAAGNPTVSGKANINVTGVESANAIGTISITGKANVTLTGAAASGLVGSVTVQAAGSTTVSLTGVQATSSAGTLTVSGKANVTLIGVSTSAAVGTLTVQTAGSTSTTLTGVQANGSAGTLTVQVQSASLDGGNGGATGKKRRNPTKFVPIERPGLPPIDKPKERKPEIVQELPAIEADEPVAVEAETINLDLLPLTPEQLIAAQAIDEADDEEVVSLLLDWMIENEAPVRATIANLLGDVLASLENDAHQRGIVDAPPYLPA